MEMIYVGSDVVAVFRRGGARSQEGQDKGVRGFTLFFSPSVGGGRYFLFVTHFPWPSLPFSSRGEFLFKLLLIGDSGVGKSCLLLRFSVRPPPSPFRFVFALGF